MFIFLVFIVGPGCGFMLYALTQFRREAMRLRRMRKAGASEGVTRVTAYPPGKRNVLENRVVVMAQPGSGRTVERGAA
jgi:hypothetical protein